MLKLYRVKQSIAVEQKGVFYQINADWDSLLNREQLHASLEREIATGAKSIPRPGDDDVRPPIGGQEVWAAGVTYHRSRDARMEEARDAGSGDFYDRVYTAERPELFFKANPHAVVGHRAGVRVRRDSHWNVPEPELALVVNSRAQIIGYTIGNDMSSRDIEGENPLYLPQAKVYDKSCALGPGILLADGPLPPETEIWIEIVRDGSPVLHERTSLAGMKRKPMELVEFLYREHSYPLGCILFTGTGIVPPDEFSLASGDEIRITIEPIGTLINWVE